MFKRRVLVVGALCLGLLALNCDLFTAGEDDDIDGRDDINTDIPAPPSSTTYYEAMSWGYTETAAGQLSVISSENECNGTTLVTTLDTSAWKYTISGDIMTVIITNDTSFDTVTLSRVNGTAGAAGLWAMVPDVDDKDDVMMVGAMVYVSASEIQIWPSKSAMADEMGAIAASVMTDFSGNDEGIDITVAPTATGFTITGGVNLEVVTLAFDTVNIAFVWTSTNAARTAYSVLFSQIMNPTTCPEPEVVPTWFEDFLMANLDMPSDTGDTSIDPIDTSDIDTTSDNDTSTGSVEGYLTVMTVSYTATGANTLTGIASKSSCDGAALVTEYDTALMTYTLSGSSLVIVTEGDTSMDTMPLISDGTNDGILGTWSVDVDDASEYADVVIIISKSTMVYALPKAMMWDVFSAQLILMEADLPPGITMDKSVAGQISLVGSVTSEVVKITINDNGNMEWSSTNALHATHEMRLFGPLTVCPEPEDDSSPVWMDEFIEDNLGSSGKLRLPKLRIPEVKLF
jgi:hypothetical protein